MVYVQNVKDIDRFAVSAPGVANVLKQTLVGPGQGWQGWVMRVFTVGAEGHTPRHSHAWPHIVYVLEGTGTLFLGGREHEVGAGHVAFIPPEAEHQFENRSGENFRFICIVPEEGDK